MGVTRCWRYSRERMQELLDEGRIVQTKPGAVPAYKRYLDEMGRAQRRRQLRDRNRAQRADDGLPRGLRLRQGRLRGSGPVKTAGTAAVILVRVEDLLKVADLIEDAEMAKHAPDLSSVTPDLMRLFAHWTRGLPIAPPRGATATPQQLVSSAREQREKRPSQSGAPR